MTLTQTVKYQTKVVEIGADAKEFKEINMLIFFGNQAPDALRSSCYIIECDKLEQTVKVGDILVIGDVDYPITAVGSEVDTNLGNLGHISVVFNGSEKAELAGSLYVQSASYPDIKVDDAVRIIAG